jgi:hypothetical protein
VPFHVEIQRSYHRARVFNLSEAELRDTVLGPWRRRAVVRLGDRDWDPGASTLRILEGRRLEPVDLALGQGWHNAERSSEDVTHRLLADAAVSAVAVLASTSVGEREAAELLTGLGLRPAVWTEVRARILDGVDGHDRLGVSAALAVSDDGEPPAGWVFDVGLALGALSPARAILLHRGRREPPASVDGARAIRMRANPAAARRELAERLERAGCAVRPKLR